MDQKNVYPNEFNDEQKQKIENLITDKHTILGIDIYKYSQYSRETQPFIPHLFEKIYEESWGLIIQNFEYIFQKYSSIRDRSRELKAQDYYIDNGDGCFQIFESPIHAIIFSLVFFTGKAFADYYEQGCEYFLYKKYDLAKENFKEASDFNAVNNLNQAFVRKKALRMFSEM